MKNKKKTKISPVAATKVDNCDLVIRFPNQAALKIFASWLCNSGEQDYWNCMEEADEGDNTVTFHYHGEEDESKAQDDPSRYKEFMEDNIIRTKIYKKGQ